MVKQGRDGVLLLYPTCTIPWDGERVPPTTFLLEPPTCYTLQYFKTVVCGAAIGIVCYQDWSLGGVRPSLVPFSYSFLRKRDWCSGYPEDGQIWENLIFTMIWAAELHDKTLFRHVLHKRNRSPGQKSSAMGLWYIWLDGWRCVGKKTAR